MFYNLVGSDGPSLMDKIMHNVMTSDNVHKLV